MVCYPQTQHDTKIKLSKNVIQYAVKTDGIILKSTYLKNKSVCKNKHTFTVMKTTTLIP